MAAQRGLDGRFATKQSAREQRKKYRETQKLLREYAADQKRLRRSAANHSRLDSRNEDGLRVHWRD